MIAEPPVARRHGIVSAEFDLRGVVGIRLVGATPADVRTVERQLGPIRAPLEREPDLVIRFLERLDPDGPIRLLAIDDAGYTDDEFLVLRSRHRTGVRVRLPLDRLGVDGSRAERDGPPQIVCERGLPAVPHLVAIVNLLALARGVAPLHASTFVHRGLGILVTGWAKGGKTETLLAALADGGSYVSDEWTYLRADGTVFGIPEPIRIWDWQLGQLSRYRSRVSRGDRARLRVMRLAIRTVGGLLELDPRRRAAPSRLLARLAPVLARQPWVRVEPARLFGSSSLAASTRVDRLIHVVSHDRPTYEAVPADSATLAGRMAASVAYEAQELRAAWLAHRFAFPDRRNDLIDSVEERTRALAETALGGVPAVEVRHPYPFRIERLFAAVIDATRS